MFYNASLGKFSFCMTINPKRFAYMCRNFDAVGVRPPVKFECVRWGNGSNMGCVLGHLAILRMAKELNLPYCIVYEDDAYPRPDILWKWEQIQNYIPPDCGLLKLGNSSYRGEFIKLNSAVGFMKSGVAFGSHAYIIRNEMYDELIENMMYVKIPDGAMSMEHYLKSRYKPYVLTFEAMLFIQKNISVDNIISVKGGQRYWYPHPVKNFGCTSGIPPKNFVDKLFDDDYKYCDELCVVYNKRWSKGRKTAVIRDGVLFTKDEKAKITKLEDNKYKLVWDKDGQEDELVFIQEKDGTKFYRITTNQPEESSKK